MSELPKSWELRKLSEVVTEIVGGGTPSKNVPRYWNGNIPWMSIKDMRTRRPADTIDHITQEAIDDSATNLIPADTVIMATRVGLGKVARVPYATTINQDLKALITSSGLDKSYLEYWLLSRAAYLEGIGSGTTVKGIRLEQVRNLEVPVAPLPEQRRIVARIEELFSRLDAGVVALRHAKAQLQRYRQSVLAAAVTGQLTQAWREQHPETEPAEELLKRILLQRREQWNGSRKDKEVTISNAENLPDLPEGWCWAPVQNLSEPKEDAIFAGPFGTIFKAKDFRDEGVPIIFLRHVGPDKYRTHKPGFMDRERWNEIFQAYSVWGGELLVTKLGEPPGVCCEYPEGIGPAMVTPDVMKLSANEHAASKRYLISYFNSEIARRFTFGVAFGTTRLRLTLPIFRSMPVPLPPLAEQHQIVAEVEARTIAIDHLEAGLDRQIMRSDRLRQSTLASAFSGGLVPQDPSDEPAKALLNRIQTMKKEMPTKKTPRKKVEKEQATAVRNKGELVKLLESLGGSATPERLLVESKLENDIDTFFELVRDASVERTIDVPIGEFGKIFLHQS